MLYKRDVLRKFSKFTDKLRRSTSGGDGEGGSPLPFFENREKVLWLWKNSSDSGNVPCLCISMGWNSHLKCNFKSILEKKDQNFSMRGLSFVCWLCAWNLRSTHPEVLCQQMFLEILQNSKKNIFAGISFLIKLQGRNLKLPEAATGDVQ